jgi:hypothetical protein
VRPKSKVLPSESGTVRKVSSRTSNGVKYVLLRMERRLRVKTREGENETVFIVLPSTHVDRDAAFVEKWHLLQPRIPTPSNEQFLFHRINRRPKPPFLVEFYHCGIAKHRARTIGLCPCEVQEILLSSMSPQLIETVDIVAVTIPTSSQPFSNNRRFTRARITSSPSIVTTSAFATEGKAVPRARQGGANA